jgi:hypothetical protein
MDSSTTMPTTPLGPSRKKEKMAEGRCRRFLLPMNLPPAWQGTAVLCVAGRGSLDEASAAMLAQLLQKHGIGARVVPSEAVSVANLFRLDVTGVQMAFLCYLEPGSFSNPCYLVRRLRRKLPRATIVVGLWTLKREEAERNALTATGADLVAVSLQQAVEQVIDNVETGAKGQVNAETPPTDCPRETGASAAPLRKSRISHRRGSALDPARTGAARPFRVLVLWGVRTTPQCMKRFCAVSAFLDGTAECEAQCRYGDPGLRPERHVFVANKAPWFEITDELPQHQGWPPIE